MVHPLVSQLRFTRSEFQRALQGLSEEDAQQRVGTMNCISWNVGHLAWQEQRYWLFRAQDKVLLPHLNELFAYGAPAYTPPLKETWEAWDTITKASDPWLDAVTTDSLQEDVLVNGKPVANFGTLLQIVIYHYWYHTGENMAIRQALGHVDLPEFVGDIAGEAPYRPESGV